VFVVIKEVISFVMVVICVVDAVDIVVVVFVLRKRE